jgi:hypothetical protein
MLTARESGVGMRRALMNAPMNRQIGFNTRGI